MDGITSRPRIVENFNSAYNRENIAITLRKLAELPPDADFLDFARKADVLVEPMTDAQFSRYREHINRRVPRPLQVLMTMVHRAALFEYPPTPMHLEMNDRTPPSLQVTCEDELISIILNRADNPPEEHRAWMRDDEDRRAMNEFLQERGAELPELAFTARYGWPAWKLD
jgi:hypothetical protein